MKTIPLLILVLVLISGCIKNEYESCVSDCKRLYYDDFCRGRGEGCSVKFYGCCTDVEIPYYDALKSCHNECKPK